jgi:uncharacterized repeat protein (TIGR01451 family)
MLVRLRPWIGVLTLAVVLLFWTAAGWTLSPAPGTPILNTVTAQYRDANGNSRPEVSSSISSPISAAPRLRLDITAESNPVAAGSTFSYTVRYENSGNAPATGVRIDDSLPAGVIFTSASNGGIFNPTSRTVTWSIGALAPGAAGSVTLSVAVPGTMTSGTPIANSATVHSSEGFRETALSTTFVGTGPNLLLTKTSTPDTVAPNGIITYALSYRNVGNSDARQIRITDQIPTGAAFIKGTALPAAMVENNVLTWNIGTLAAGSQGTISFQVHVSPLATVGTIIRNVFTVNSIDTAVASSNQLLTPVVPLIVHPSLQFTGSAPPGTVAPGAQIVYTYTVTNDGDVTVTGIAIDDPLPPGTSFVAADAPATTAAGSVRVTIENLSPGATKTVHLTLSVDAVGTAGKTITNSATLSSVEAPAKAVVVPVIVSTPTHPSLQFIGSAPSGPVAPGAQIVYTYTVTNDGDVTVTGISIDDTLPQGTSFVAADAPATTAAGSVRVTVSDLSPGATKTVHLTLAVDATGTAGKTITNSATLSSVEAPAKTAVVPVTVSTPTHPSLQFSGSAPPGTVAPGAQIVYTYTVTNDGDVTVTGITIDDPLPPGTSFVAADAPATTAAGSVRVTVSDLPPGATKTVHLTLSVDAVGTAGKTITNSATLSSVEAPAKTAVVPVTVSTPTHPSLQFSGSAPPGTVAPGAQIVYTYTVTNDGDVTVTGITIDDPLPPGTSFVAADAPATTAAGSVRVTVSDLPPGATKTVHLTLSVDAVGTAGKTITNSATLSSVEAPAKTAVVPVTVSTPTHPSLQFTGSAPPGPVAPGAQIVYTYTVTNDGDVTVTDIAIDDTLPPGTSFVAADAPATTAAGSVRVTVGNLSPGATKTVHLTLAVDATGTVGKTITNSVMLSSVEAPAKTVVVPVTVGTPLLSIRNIAITNTARPGNMLSYIIELKNDGDIPVSGITLRNALPSGVSFVQANGGGTEQDRTIRWSVAAIEPGNRVTVQLDVTLDKAYKEAAISNTAYVSATGISELSATAASNIFPRTAGVVEFIEQKVAKSSQYLVGDKICLQVTDPDRNTDSTRAETVSVTVEHAGKPSFVVDDSLALDLPETAIGSGVFRGCFNSDAGPPLPGDAVLSLTRNSSIRAIYSDPLDLIPVLTASVFIDPFGIVFNSISGAPVANAIVRLIDDATGRDAILPQPPLVPEVQNNPITTTVDGRYKFQYVNPGSYHLVVTPASSATEFSYPSLIGDADLPNGYVVLSASRGNSFLLTDGMKPLYLDIPVDPPPGQLLVVKSASKDIAAIGDLVTYSVAVSNVGKTGATAIDITDTMPHGIPYLKGSSRIGDNQAADPQYTSERTVIWRLASLDAGETVTITYKAVVGADSKRGDGRNTVYGQGMSAGKQIISNKAVKTITITEGVFTSDGIIIGKVLQRPHSGKTADEPYGAGVPGVSLYMEDGSRVVTDGDGKYSISGVPPGNHILRLDETTLPKGLKPVSGSNRFMGSATSQFIDIPRGGMFTADFTVVQTTPQAPPAIPEQRFFEDNSPALPSSAESGAPLLFTFLDPDAYTKEFTIEETPISDGKISILHSRPSSGLPYNREATGKQMRATASEQKDLEKEILDMSPQLEFLNLHDGDLLKSSQIKFMVKAGAEAVLTVSVNGRQIPSDRIGRKIASRQATIYEYINVALEPGEKNRINAEVRDPWGNLRESVTLDVFAGGTAAKIEVIPDVKEVAADGAATVKVKIRILDKNGSLVSYPDKVTVEVSFGEIIEQDSDPSMAGLQVPCSQGVAGFTVKAPFETGESRILVSYNGIEQESMLFFAPHLRKMLIVGMGEATVGYGKTSGAYNLLNRDTHFDKDLYAWGRGAFFAKGEIGNGMLLTASYDSEKKVREDFFRAGATNPEAEDKYPLYGDESKTGYEALSREKLFVRVDKDRSFALYGDYETGIGGTRLSQFNRTLTGLKTDINLDYLKVTGFASESDHSQVVDRIPGRGISGFYQLSRKAVDGSERIVIETRDRDQIGRVINREIVSRWSDYRIDYDLGTILFKAPVPSHDSNLNPIFIIATYETAGSGAKYALYGGRTVLKPVNWLELGVTGVTEQKQTSDYHLRGADLTLRLPGNTTVKAEMAETDSLFDIDSSLTRKTGNGWGVEVESAPLPRMLLSGYYRVVSDFFDNPSATDSMRGTTKYGVNAQYLVDQSLLLKAKYFDEKDRLFAIDHTLASTSIEKTIGKAKLGIELLRETASDHYLPTTGGATKTPFDIAPEAAREMTGVRVSGLTPLWDGVSLSVSHLQDLQYNRHNESQAAINYQIAPGQRLYVREEFARYQERTESRTVVGGESQLGKNTVAFNEYRLASGVNGSRSQESIGLRNKFLLGQGITANLNLEKLVSIKGSQRSTEPDAFAAAGSIEYLALSNIKITSRVEYRQERSVQQPQDSWLGELITSFKLSQDYTLQFAERYFLNDLKQQGERVTTRTSLGLAYRPVLLDRFNALGKVEFKHEENDIKPLHDTSSAYIFSLEGIYRATSKLQLIGKYAGKTVAENGFNCYTDLYAGRILYDLTRRVDVGGEYRILNSYATHSVQQGGTAEVGYRVVDNAWVSAGYSFDRFDADLAGDSYMGQGPFVRLRIKFDESSLKKPRN